MFHGSVMGKIVTPINVSDEKRPSGNTRRRATYTVCTGKDGYGKNSHFCNMDMVAIGGEEVAQGRPCVRCLPRRGGG